MESSYSQEITDELIKPEKYLVAVSPFKSLSDEQLEQLKELGEVVVLNEEGDFSDQLREGFKSGKYNDITSIISHAGDGGTLKVAEVAQEYERYLIPLPAGTGNDVAISVLDNQEGYTNLDKVPNKLALEIWEKSMGAIKEGKFIERDMDALHYTAVGDDGHELERHSYIGHHMHVIAKAGEMTGFWNKLKRIGPIAYVLRGMTAILTQEPTDLTVIARGDIEKLSRYDGEPTWTPVGDYFEIDGQDIWAAQTLNTTTTGGGKIKIEGESAFDGKFSLLYVKSGEYGSSRMELLKISNKLNRSIYLDGVEAIRGIKTLEIRSEQGFDFGVDGEMYGDLKSGYVDGGNGSKVYSLKINMEPKAVKMKIPLISQEVL
ncbi:MAG: hypothetical protein GOV01_00335 [Candidatus Altiarchaeota archaeon]|nr:hypothetical protein [Candidatus Altiarchaeota archaeon]